MVVASRKYFLLELCHEPYLTTEIYKNNKVDQNINSLLKCVQTTVKSESVILLIIHYGIVWRLATRCRGQRPATASTADVKTADVRTVSRVEYVVQMTDRPHLLPEGEEEELTDYFCCQLLQDLLCC